MKIVDHKFPITPIKACMDTGTTCDDCGLITCRGMIGDWKQHVMSVDESLAGDDWRLETARDYYGRITRRG